VTSRREIPWSGKIQQDAIEVNQFSWHCHDLEYPVRAANLGLAGRTMMIVKTMHLNRGARLVDCRQRARMRCSLRLGIEDVTEWTT
jgi:hypothetical protein